VSVELTLQLEVPDRKEEIDNVMSLVNQEELENPNIGTLPPIISNEFIHLDVSYRDNLLSYDTIVETLQHIT